MLKIQRISFLACLFLLVACQRAAEEKTTLKLSLPPVEKLSSSSATGCTVCLKFLAVNISGEGIASTIYAKKEHGDFSEEGTEISSEIELEVPVGKQRFFQVVAAYSDSDEDIEIKYGTTTVDLTSSTNLVSLSITSLGEFKGGHIAGRFLTGTNSGPTGVVNINLIPVPGLRAFTLFKTHITNGWFDFFASKNFEITYEMEGGGPLLSNIKLDDDFLPASLTSSSQVVRIVRPEDYDEFNGSTWSAKSDEDSDLVIGYFFAPGVSDPNKKVCKQSSPQTLNRLSSDGGTTYMQYNPTGGAGDVRVFGGFTSGDHADCGSAYTQQYNPNVILLDSEQFNGMGNDTAKSLQGAFSYFKVSGQMKKFTSTGTVFQFQFLPHLVGSHYDGAKLYRSSTRPADQDNIVCRSDFMTANGFSEVPLSSTSISGTTLTLTTVSAISSGYGIICPSMMGELRGHGGAYLDSLAPSGGPAVLTVSSGPTYNYGTVANGANVTQTFTVSNSGGSTATGLTGSGLAAPFIFSGGSYPGGSGTCASTLASGASCTISVSFSPASSGVHTDSIEIYYNDSVSAQVASRGVTGTGAAPAVLSISGTTNFGLVTVGNPQPGTFTVTNSGGVNAFTLFSNSLTAPYTYLGGSFPGSGGTCSASLAPASSCTVVVEFVPTSPITFNEVIEVLYNNGVTGQMATLAITGQGN